MIVFDLKKGNISSCPIRINLQWEIFQILSYYTFIFKSEICLLFNLKVTIFIFEFTAPSDLWLHINNLLYHIRLYKQIISIFLWTIISVRGDGRIGWRKAIVTKSWNTPVVASLIISSISYLMILTDWKMR